MRSRPPVLPHESGIPGHSSRFHSKRSAAQKGLQLVTIAAIQSICVADDVDTNVTTALSGIRHAAAQGAQVVCLQELFTCQYFCQTEDHRFFDLAEPVPGPTCERLGALAKELGIVIVAALFERRAAGIFHNTAVVFDTDGSLVERYRKMHIPDDPCFLEKFYFTPGDLGFRVAETRMGRIGVCICWDQWFPEAARLSAMNGAEIIVFPTAIGWLDEDREKYGESQRDAWRTMMRSHAIANGVFVVAPNRAGREQQIQFWGSSFICDPYGRVLAKAKSEEPDQILAECHLDQIEVARTHWPFLRDRRIDAYDGITKRWLHD